MGIHNCVYRICVYISIYLKECVFIYVHGIYICAWILDM